MKYAMITYVNQGTMEHPTFEVRGHERERVSELILTTPDRVDAMTEAFHHHVPVMHGWVNQPWIAVVLRRLQKDDTKAEVGAGLERVQDELRSGFIIREYQAICPQLTASMEDQARLMYQHDPIFHNRVDAIVSAVVAIITKNIQRRNL